MSKPAANDNAASKARGKPRSCPICGKPPVAASAPFCSPRCADVDLHRWLGGAYVIATDADTDDSTMAGEPD